VTLTSIDWLVIFLIALLANFMTMIIYLSYIKRDLDNGKWDEVGEMIEEWLIETIRKSTY